MHECKTCGRTFETGMKLGGHQQMHLRTFDQLRSDGARKTHLIIERGHRCEVCSITEWCGKPTPIELDHIDGNPEHNTKENLRLICPNCHAQTETYKGRNIGKVQNTKRAQKLKRFYGAYR